MKTHKPAPWTTRVAAAAVTAALLAQPATALAAVASIDGVDHWFDAAQQADGATSGIDVVAVAGDPDTTVYLDVLAGDTTIASHLAYRLEDLLAAGDGTQEAVSVLGVAIQAFDPAQSYAVRVYDTRDYAPGDAPLYEGELTVVWGLFEGEDAPAPIATQTRSASEQASLAPHQTVAHNGATYQLTSVDPVADPAGLGRTVYAYALAQDAATTVIGHVTYVDLATGETLQQQDVILTRGEGATTVPVEKVINAAGAFYRTLWLRDTVELAYPGTTDYTIQCKSIEQGWNHEDPTYHEATISYVDEVGNPLDVSGLTGVGLVDVVPVFRTTTYTPPTTIYVGAGEDVVAYELISVATDPSANPALGENGALVLSPSDGDASFAIRYRRLGEEDGRWTIRLVDGTVGQSSSARTIKTVTLTGQPGTTATYEPEASLTVNGQELVPAATTQASYEHTFSAGNLGAEQVIYYVPASFDAHDPYDITINYVNIATGEVIASQTRTVSLEDRADLHVQVPASFAQDGVQWVLLNGQAPEFAHSYYEPTRTYTVYYRDINDDLHEATVITTIRTVYDPTVTVITDGGTTAAGGGTGGGAGSAAGTATTQLQSDGGLRAVSGEEGTTLVRDDGSTLTEERIDDDATPLAGPDADATAADAADAAGSVLGRGAWLGIAAALAAVAGGLFVALGKRRADNGQDEQN